MRVKPSSIFHIAIKLSIVTLNIMSTIEKQLEFSEIFITQSIQTLEIAKFTIQTLINAFNRHNHKNTYIKIYEKFTEELQQIVNLLMHRLTATFMEAGLARFTNHSDDHRISNTKSRLQLSRHSAGDQVSSRCRLSSRERN